MIDSVALPDLGARSDIAAILAALHEPAVVLDRAGVVVAANAAFCGTFGLQMPQLRGRALFELDSGGWDLPELRRLLENDLPRERLVRDVAATYSPPGGRPIPVRINASWLDEAGLVLLAIETAETEGDAAIRHSVAHLITAIDHLPMGVGFTDRDGRFVLANPEMQRFAMKVVPSSDPPRAERWRGYHPDGRRIAVSDYPAARALRGETVQPGLEFAFSADDGREIWTRVAAVPLRDGAGEVTGAAVVVSDITSHKQVEATLRASEARARRTLDELEATYKTAPIGLCVLDTDLRFVRINDRLAEMNGVPIADHIGRTPREIVPAVAEQAEALLRRVLDTGEPLLNVEVTGETSAHPGVQGIWNENWFPLRDDEGRVIGVTVVAEEITERKRNEERLKLLAQEVDHRSKNVLTLVATLVRLTRAGSVAEYRQNLLGRLNALARSHQLLAASRWHGADLRDLISQDLAAYKADDAARVTIDGAHIEVRPSAAQALSMAVHELATNAAKYGALSVRSGRVAVSWTLRGGALHLAWSETDGPAVAAPERTGLGSDIIRRSICDQLEGEVSMDWAPSGLTCALTVPAKNLVQA